MLWRCLPDKQRRAASAFRHQTGSDAAMLI